MKQGMNQGEGEGGGGHPGWPLAGSHDKVKDRASGGGGIRTDNEVSIQSRTTQQEAFRGHLNRPYHIYPLALPRIELEPHSQGASVERPHHALVPYALAQSAWPRRPHTLCQDPGRREPREQQQQGREEGKEEGRQQAAAAVAPPAPRRRTP